jgi:DNA-directed RNA polymerase sigma subunit (sigma70/sigma32)
MDGAAPPAPQTDSMIDAPVKPEPGAEDSLQLLLAEISSHRLLTAAEEVALAKRIERGDVEAKHRMVSRTCGSSSRSPSATRAWGSRSST